MFFCHDDRKRHSVIKTTEEHFKFYTRACSAHADGEINTECKEYQMSTLFLCIRSNYRWILFNVNGCADTRTRVYFKRMLHNRIIH